ncbi:hypothetical protein PG984_003044 [Apiospora sp. TS-2023a]
MAIGLQDFPAEVLLQILKAVADKPDSDIFFPEYAVLPGRFSPERAMEIHYTHNADTKRYCRNIPIDQKQHVFDWLALNSTCRSIRSLGREAFYSTKCFAMTSSLPDDLQQVGLSSIQDPRRPEHWWSNDRRKDRQREYASRMASIGQWLELARIQRVMFIDNVSGRPSDIISLPRRLRHFNKPDDSARDKQIHALKSCILVYGLFSWGTDKSGVLEAAVSRRAADIEKDKNQLAMETELSALLHDLGQPGDIQFNLAFVVQLDVWSSLDALRRTVFPMLRIKAQALKRHGLVTLQADRQPWR